jgi:hypothetical protein
MKISSIIQGFYIFYMYNIFKTKYSIHHPFENRFNTKLLKHPIKTGRYESKICLLGKYVGGFLLLWFLFRHKIKNDCYSNIIIFIVTSGSLIMNINAFIYLIPILLIEYL